VEPRFAENAANADDQLCELVDAARARGTYVILDIVLNHVGDVFQYQCDAQDPFCQQNNGWQGYLPRECAAGDERDPHDELRNEATPIEECGPANCSRMLCSGGAGACREGDGPVGDFDT
jgi:hypothetical protein